MSRSPHHSSPADLDASATDWLLRSEAGLTEAERAEFEQWQAADPQHRSALDRARRTWTTLDRPRLAGRDLEMVGLLRARATRRRYRRIASLTVACAAVILVALQWKSRHDAEAWPATARLIAPEKRVLSDGSVIELRPGADLAVDYSGEFRRVTLRAGDALFHVAKDPARPFIVGSGAIAVRAVGTAFLVAKTSAQVDVVVTEGRVAVAQLEAALPSAVVDAGQRARMNLAPGAGPPVVDALSAADLAALLDWRTPRVAFTAATLTDAVTLMNRHSSLRLVIEDVSLAELPVSGVFRLGNSETMVRLLETAFGVKAERTGETIRLSKAR